ncbi:uncharacterized mitochondrial protein-like protein, partial [Tanacetum coccineum]
VPVEHKAPNTSSYTRKKDSKGKKPGAKSGHRKQPTSSKHHPLSKIKATKFSTIIHSKSASEHDVLAKSKVGADSGLSAPKDSISQTTDKTKSASEGLETVLTQPTTGKGAIDIAKKIKEEFNTSPDLSNSEDTQKEIKMEDLSRLNHKLEKQKSKAEAEIVILSDQPPFTNVEQLTKLLVESIQAKIKTLDAFPSLLNGVTQALNKFAQVIESALTKAGDKDLFQKKAAKDTKKALNKQQPIPTPPLITTTVTPSTTSSLQSPFLPIPLKSSNQLEGKHINKDKGKKAISLKDAEEEGSESDSDDTIHLTGFMVESSKKKKLKKFDFVTESGDHFHLTEEQIKEQKRIKESAKAEAAKHEVKTGKGWTTIYEQIKTRMDYLHQTEAELGIDLNKPLTNKRLKSLVQYEDHPAGIVLNEPIVGMIILHQGPGLDDHARTFSSFLLAKVDKRNLNPLKQIRTIEQLRLKPHQAYGTYTWKINKFSQITKRKLRSNAFEFCGYKWYVILDIDPCGLAKVKQRDDFHQEMFKLMGWPMQEKSKMVASAFGEDQGDNSALRPIGLFFLIASVSYNTVDSMLHIVIESLPLDDDIHVLRREVSMVLE